MPTFQRKHYPHKLSLEEKMTLTRLSGYVFLVAFSQFACGGSHFVVKSNDSPQEIAKPAVQVHSDRLQKLLDSPTISPYAIENYIKESAESDEEFVDFKPIWESLHIPKNIDEAFLENGKEIFEGFKPSYSRWLVDLIDAQNADKQINRKIVRIRVYGGAIRRFLIFTPESPSFSDKHWKFSGYFDISYHKELPDIQKFYDVYGNDTGLWLILRDGDGYGTGVSQTYEMWYRIDTENPKEVAHYAIEGGRVNDCICDVEYESNAKTLIDKDGILIREITYKVSFGTAYKPNFHWLGTKTSMISFRWDDNAGKFIYDARNSTISEEELKREFGGWNSEDFIKYNFDDLINFAKTANSEQKVWLEEVLENLKDEDQKVKLRNALDR
jgi:hypothetical protein